MTFRSNPGNVAVAAAASTDRVLRHPGYVSGENYLLWEYPGGRPSPKTVVADVIWYLPGFAFLSHTFAKFGFVNGASMNGASVRVGVYSDKDGKPDLLLNEGATVSVADSNTNAIRLSALSQTLPKGPFWLALLADTAIGNMNGAVNFVSDAGGSNNGSLYTWRSLAMPTFVNSSVMSHGTWKEAQAFGALPATATPVFDAEIKTPFIVAEA